MKYISSIVGLVVFMGTVYGGGKLYNYFTLKSLNWPQVGDCYEVNHKNIPEFYEIRKVITVHPTTDKYADDTISYVYNFTNDPNFQKGKWYIAKPLTDTDYYWFFEVNQAKPIACPW